MKEQQLTIARLQSQGFRIESEGRGVLMARGNDYRIVQQDGTQKRAYGAKR